MWPNQAKLPKGEKWRNPEKLPDASAGLEMLEIAKKRNHLARFKPVANYSAEKRSHPEKLSEASGIWK